MPKSRLLRFEAIAQRLVEGSFNRLLGGRLDVHEVSAKLARAIEDNQRDGFVPNRYMIRLNPADFGRWRSEQPTVETDLADFVVALVQESKAKIVSLPQVELAPDAGLARDAVRIEVEHVEGASDATQLFAKSQETSGGHTVRSLLEALDGFLIIDGREHVPLRARILTLGRRNNNDIVLASPSVSRRHAQIRWQFGRFIISDLGSRSGTIVNGERVDEYALQAGDVIQLSDVSMIYGEGLGTTQRNNFRPSLSDATQSYRGDDEK